MTRGESCAVLLVLALSACGPSPEPAAADEEDYAFRGITIYEKPPAGDFALADQHGRPFRLSDARGRVVVLFFGYVHCPDVCPTTLSSWARVEQELGSAAQGVDFVFVSVDPERDTPERLARHLAAFSPRFTGITGSPEELEPLYQAYDIHHEAVSISDSAAGYLVDHTTRMFVVDQEGRLRVKYDFRTRPEDIARDIRWLLEHGP